MGTPPTQEEDRVPTRFDGVLRWYPEEWRRRYGEELVALLEETVGDRDLPLGCRLSLMRAGCVERFRRGAAARRRAGPEERIRSGALLVLWAWAAFVVAGAGFAKFSEHWDLVTPPSDRRVPNAAYAVVQGAGFAGALLVVVGALVCLPAAVRFVRRGGWPAVRRPVLLAVAGTGLALAQGAGLVAWAHRLTAPARNGALWPYSLAGAALAVSVCASIGLSAAAAVSVVRRLDLGRRVLLAEALLALTMLGVLAVIAAGMVVWWVSVARAAPDFLAGGPVGWPGSPAPATLLVAGTLMVGGLGAALVGAGRVTRALRAVPPGPA